MISIESIFWLFLFLGARKPSYDCMTVEHRRIAHILASKAQSLPGTFREIYGDLPLPRIVHDSDGKRQERIRDAYTRDEDFHFLKVANCEMRLLIALLVSVIVSSSKTEQTPEAAERRFHAAAVLRDLMNSLLAQIAGSSHDANFQMPGVVLGNECFAVTAKIRVAGLDSSRRLPRDRCWQRLQEWWDQVSHGDLDLPCEVLQTSVRPLVLGVRFSLPSKAGFSLV